MRYRSTALSVLMGLALMLVSSAALAQYNLVNLDSNQVGKAAHTDPLMVNGWGLAKGPGSPWWVSDNLSGWSTLYDGSGNIQGLKVVIPTAGNGPTSPTGGNGPGSPTGIVYNNSPDASEFQVGGWPSIFLFATLDGTISGWSFLTNPNQAVLAVDNSSSKASYTGLAITNKPTKNFIYAADQANNKIDVYDGNFNPAKLAAGAFTDPAIPAGFAPFGIQDIGGVVYVAYASTSGAAGGFVDRFREDGTHIGDMPLVSGAPLNQPWGIAAAPGNFGPLSNTLLVSNNINRDGTINAFNTATGQFAGTVKDKNGKPIQIDQLWGIAFGDGLGSNGPSNRLFFTAGPSNNLAGTFGAISFE
jgi:uncharacterized protein (TIGR03118 family)